VGGTMMHCGWHKETGDCVTWVGVSAGLCHSAPSHYHAGYSGHPRWWHLHRTDAVEVKLHPWWRSKDVASDIVITTFLETEMTMYFVTGISYVHNGKYGVTFLNPIWHDDHELTVQHWWWCHKDTKSFVTYLRFRNVTSYFQSRMDSFVGSLMSSLHNICI